MVWVLMAVGVLALAWFLFAPRRLQTIENVKSVVDQDLHGHNEVETTEDPREWNDIAYPAAKRAGDIRNKGDE